MSTMPQPIVNGVIRGLTKRKVPTEVNGQIKTVESDIFEVILPNNVIGYCPVKELRYVELSPSSYARHVGTTQPFVILGQEENIAIVSCKRALEQKADELWETLSQYTDEQIYAMMFQLEDTHYNVKQNQIYGLINGHVCSMYPSDWNYSTRGQLDIQDGECVDVKIVMINREKKIIRVSRKACMPDPFEFLRTLNIGDTIAAKVSAIHPQHGIFIRFDNHAELKASVLRSLPRPNVGDIVSCRLEQIDFETRKGRVKIIGYPQGQRRIVDIGAFLYAD